MKFLNVLCVVIYFRSGDFSELQNTVLQSQYQNQGSIQFDSQRNIGRPLNNGYNNFRESQTKARFVGRLNPEEAQANLRFEQPHIYPENINYKQFNRVNEKPLNQPVNPKLESQYFQNPQELGPVYINPQELHSLYANIEEKRFNDAQLAQREVNSRATLQLQSTSSYLPQQQYKEPAQRTLGINPEIKSVTYPYSINTQLIKNGNIAPIISNTDTELELQGISPELIQSMINQNNMKLKTLDSVQSHVSLPKSYEHVRSLENKRYIDNRKPSYSNGFHSDQNSAKFESPSAEVLYNMKKALPYIIRSQQQPSISQDNINFKNIVPKTGRLEDIIRSTPPVKRYMIIHPSGRVEHVDDIEQIAKIHPNYVMIKSQDVLKYINGKTMVQGLQVPPPKITLPVNNYQQISPINQKQYSTVEQQINKMLPSQILSTQISIKDMEAMESIVPNKTNGVASEIPFLVDITSKKPISLPNNNSQQKINNFLNKEISQNITSVLPSTVQTSTGFKSELNITNSLPIIKVQEIPNIERASENFTDQQPDVALSAKNNKNGVDGISKTPLESTVSTTIDEVENQTQVEKANFVISENITGKPQYEVEICTSEESSEESGEYDSSISPVSEISSVVQVNGETLNVISENSTSSDSSISAINVEPLNQPNNSVEFNVSKTYIRPNLYINNEMPQNIYNNESTINVTEATTPLIAFLNETKIPSDEKLSTNTTRREISLKGENINLNTSNSGGFWFQSDDLFWQNITNSNDTQKFYFLFPPKPSVIEKDTKTTIYPNGTTVEEISETRDVDGVPTVVRTIKVSHANSTVIDV